MNPIAAAALDASIAPLSIAQLRTWQAVEDGEAVDVSALTITLEAAVDDATLRAAVAHVARRHSMLRATLATIDGRPMLRFATSPYDVLAIVAGDGDNIARRADTVVHHEFDLRTQPGWRVTAYRGTFQQMSIDLTLHPFAGDARSLAIVASELMAALTGQPFTTQSAGYGDYARWQRRWLVSDEAEREIARRATEITRDPPLDFRRRKRTSTPVNESERGLGVDCLCSSGVMDALREIAKAAGIALDVALVALFGALLGRLAGQSACVLPLLRGCGVQPEWDGVVGPASEEIAVRVDAVDEVSLRDLFARVSGAVVLASGRAPLGRVFERAAIDPASVAARVVVVPSVAPSGTGAIAAQAIVPAGPSLDLVATIGCDAVALRLVHDGQVLDREQLAVLAEQFVALVTQAVGMPERAVGEHSLVTAGTRAVLPDPMSAIVSPPQEPVVETILRQATARPGDVAIAHGDARVTYAQLADASQRLARALRAAGVDRGGVVAVTGELSPGYIVAMLAVLRSGAVLLAIDPRITPTRRSLMAQEARAVAVVRIGADPLADMPSLRFAISADAGALEGEFDDRTPLPAISANDPAFVTFTSGTTGVPKAALWLHAGVAHFVKWQRETFDVGPGDRAAQLANLSFAVATRDVFTPLTAGAMLLLPPRDWVYMGATQLMEWVARERITVIQAVPSLLRSWLAAIAPPAQFAMRIVFCASEPLDSTLVRAARAAFGNGCRIVNLFGATELCQAKMHFEVPREPAPRLQPVGWAVPDTQALIIRGDRTQAGVGEPGEIVVRSPFIARGYLNAQGDRGFRRNPFRDDPEDRVYATGDVGYAEVDGAITVCGRIDDQLKIRGVRVEPAEVAAVIRAHPRIADAFVVAHGEGDASALYAYVVARNAPPAVHEIRAWIAERLVDAMVPASIRFLERLPLNANGKVDRAALSAPERAVAKRVPPRDDLEAAVLSIWSSVLSRGDLGVTDDFFENGGDSLAATRVLARIHIELDAVLPISALFDASTVADLARAVGKLRRAATST